MDSLFLAGVFFDVVLPKDRAYLNHYFTTTVQQAFLKYMHVFHDHKLFMEHTGHYCSKRMVQALIVRLRMIEQAHKKAKAEMDFDLLAKIESGKYPKKKKK